MKILVIAYAPQKIAPYLKKYKKLLERAKIEYDYCTRENTDDVMDTEMENNQIVIKYKKRRNPFHKIRGILYWRKTVIALLETGKYEKVICLTCYPAIILCDYLEKHFKNNYVVDIRDYYPFLSYPLIWRKFRKCLENDSMTVISSPGFRRWLPIQDKVYEIHNIDVDEYVNEENVLRDENFLKKTICIGYLGVVSYYDMNEKILSSLCNCKDYRVEYHGVYLENKRLQNYCDSMKMENVFFGGKFDVAEKKGIYKSIDIINAVYGNSSLIVTTALPNKLYDAVLYHKPIMVSKGTYLGNLVEQYCLGFAVDLEKDIKMQIDTFCRSFNAKRFAANADFFLSECSKTNHATEKEIIDILQSY